MPAHEIGLMLSLSLRFVPTLMDDTTRIMNAQKARGVDFGEGNIIQKVRSIIPILIPCLHQAFKRADALAIAMEARGYQGGEGRTKISSTFMEWSRYLINYCYFSFRINAFFILRVNSLR